MTGIALASTPAPAPAPAPVVPAAWLTQRERVATWCVCCGSKSLKKSAAILMPFVAHRVFGWKPIQIDASWGLETIKHGMAYTLCNSTLCSDCGFLFLDMRFSESELASLYQGYRDEKYSELRETYEPGYKQRNADLVSGVNYVEQVESFLAPRLSFPVRILDWGGDTGKNTPFKQKNRVFHIYDISNKEPIAGARRIDKAEALRTHYDLIVCSNVLEHVPYPAELLLEIRPVMQAGTILYVEVPYEEIMRTADRDQALHTKKRHWHEHINFYSMESLRRLLAACGYKILEMRLLRVCVFDTTYNQLQLACTI